VSFNDLEIRSRQKRDLFFSPYFFFVQHTAPLRKQSENRLGLPCMDNTDIAARLELLSKLMDIHRENTFKSRSYANASLTVEKLPLQLRDMPEAEIFRSRGIGDAIGKKILGMVGTGKFPLLEEYLLKTPEGIVEMLRIKGLGPKKIATIWKELEVESLGELLYACDENRLLLYKGFGKKSQESIRQAIEFYFSNRQLFRFADIEVPGLEAEAQLRLQLAPIPVSLTGDFRRQMPVIRNIELVIGASQQEVRQLVGASFTLVSEENHILNYRMAEKYPIVLHCCPQVSFASTLLETTGSADFLEEFEGLPKSIALNEYGSEQEIFQNAGLSFIHPARREEGVLARLKEPGQATEIIELKDIRGIIHCHSNWSDGDQGLEDMAMDCKDMGFEYMVISDHSRSAFYAQGLSPERVLAQQQHVSELNGRLSPFRIFKSIESDILADGSLDYPAELLATFDLVIASVHSNLKMSGEKAMMRLLRAIENPYTTILGHPTGRLLLSREGYPVDHERIIDACALHQVVIELNAHPNRLDIDWRWIGRVMDKQGMISIDPDAHSTKDFAHIRYGVLAAQKGGLIPRCNLSSFGREQLAEWLMQRKNHRG
jgi:DNA polymerase (family 10)